MDGLWRWYRRLRGLLFRSRVEREVAEEMAHHVEMATREHLARGLDPAEARRRALLDFGGVERYRAEARAGRWGWRFEVLCQDLRLSLRRLRRSTVFTGVVLATLGLGIGAATAIWSLVDAALLRPLPYADDALRIATSWEGSPAASISPAEYLDYREQLGGVMRAVGVYSFGGVNLLGEGEPERVRATFASSGLFAALGVEPALGRAFSDEEDLAGAGVALISDSLWRRRFGADPGALGQTLLANGFATEVIGVLPPDFRLPEEQLSGEASQLVAPLGIDPAQVRDRGSHYLSGVARPLPGVSAAEARRALETLGARFSELHPGDYPAGMGFEVTAVPLAEHVRGPLRAPLAVLLGAVGFLLVIACVNVAGLLLARADGHERELALRTAIGASRGRLVSQTLVESLLLALAGGLLGAALAHLALQSLLALAPVELPWLAAAGLDARMLAFALVLSAITGLLFALAPALQASRTALSGALHEGGRGSSGSRRGQRLRRTLVVAEIAVALVLLAGAALLGRSFLALLKVDPGFRTEGVVSTRLTLPRVAYPEDEDVTSFYRQAVARLGELPGVEAAGAVTNLPLATGLGDMGFIIEGRPLPEGADEPAADWQAVTPGYLEAMGLHLLRGRTIGEDDVAGRPGAVVINETFAELHWPGESPLGKRFELGGEHTEPRRVAVVGVVADVRHESLHQERRPQMYLPHAQFRRWSDGRALTWMTLVVRSSSPAAELRPAITGAVRTLDADLPLSSFRTMSEVRRAALAVPRLLTTVVMAFSAVALLLAAVGLYGLVSYAVARRKGELAVRQALGARPDELVRMVLAQGMRLALVGVAFGLAGAWLLTRGLGAVLFDVAPGDPPTLLLTAAALAAVALLAAWAPARRASRADVVELLRAE